MAGRQSEEYPWKTQASRIPRPSFRWTIRSNATRKISPPKQDQPEPGLDSKLEPAADHGEESYIGTGRLKGRKALVTGGDSGIGAAVAIAFAREGADVAIAYLPAEEEDARRIISVIESGPGGLGLPGDLLEAEYRNSLVDRRRRNWAGWTSW